jgi:hypothetical protein
MNSLAIPNRCDPAGTSDPKQRPGHRVLLARAPGRPCTIATIRGRRPATPLTGVAGALGQLVPVAGAEVQALISPLTAGRVVATDLVRGRNYVAEIERFDESAALGDPLADPREFFIQWVRLWQQWAAAGHLSDPVLAVTLRALQAVGRAHGWRDADFRVTGGALGR